MSSQTREVVSAIEKYVERSRRGKKGGYDDFLKVAEHRLEGVDDSYRGVTLYFMGDSYFKKGNYDKGKTLILDALKNSYDSTTEVFGDREKIRTLGASRLSEEAAQRGRVQDIREVNGIIGTDAVLDRLYVRDMDGKIVGRTKVSYVLKLREAQALKNSGKQQEALPILDELYFSSGSIVVDGEVKKIRDVAKELKGDIEASSK